MCSWLRRWPRLAPCCGCQAKAGLGKPDLNTRSWVPTTPAAHRNGALRRTPCAPRVQKGPGEEVLALRTAKTSSSALHRTTSWIS